MKLYKLMRKPPFFLSVSHWITKKDRPIKSGPNSRKAIMVPLIIFQYGKSAKDAKHFKEIGGNFISCIKGMRESAKNITKNPHSGKRAIDEITLRDMETYAKKLGISSLGYTKVNPNYIFKGFEILYENAVILTMEMNKELIATSPSLECSKEIFRTYTGLGIAVNKIADFLRERGYNCQASPALGGDINTVPAAHDANLGCVGKNGLVVTPDFGPCARLAAVFIDVDNLPIAKENEHEWIKDFCDTCNRCVKACPGGAIYENPKVLADGSKVYIDVEKCGPVFSKGCSVCISSCVFTGGHYAKIKNSFMKRKTNNSIKE